VLHESHFFVVDPGMYQVAASEKALLDWFYLEPKRGAEPIPDAIDFRKLDREKLLTSVRHYQDYRARFDQNRALPQVPEDCTCSGGESTVRIF
jgi:hypothetical protein